MDTTQQTINEIRGTYTDLIDRMHEEFHGPAKPDEISVVRRRVRRRARGEAPQDAAPWPERVVAYELFYGSQTPTGLI